MMVPPIRFVRLTVSAIALALLLALTVETSFAAPPPPFEAETLARVFQAETVAVARARAALARIVVYQDTAAATIARLTAQGADTNALEAALASFAAATTAALAEVQAAHQLVNQHAGFDANGQVTDVVAATRTVRAIAAHLRAAHRIATQARQQFMVALDAFRAANPTRPSPPNPPLLPVLPPFPRAGAFSIGTPGWA